MNVIAIFALCWMCFGVGICVGALLAAAGREPSDDNLPKCPNAVPEWLTAD